MNPNADPSRMIFVCGTPTGGTSCVAGILHHLGVDMGPKLAENPERPYAIYEDKAAYDFRAEPNDSTQACGQQGGRDFRAYIKWRQAQANGRPFGAKLGSSCWLCDPEPETLPLRIIKVNRPLETSIRSDLKYQALAGRVRDDFKIQRASQLGAYWMAKEILCEKIKPALQLSYEQVLVNPKLSVIAIQHALRLEPNRGQMEAAVASVRRPDDP